MPESKPLVLGSTVWLTGDVTQNRWVGAFSARRLEENLGFGAGRLAHGWKVLLLKQQLTPADFRLSGTTLRSGGRLGLPAANAALDKLRPTMHDKIMREDGAAGYLNFQRHALKGITADGPDRLVKVVPVSRHSSETPPADQYPMGGGGLQWTLIRPCRFLVAMTVNEHHIAVIASDPPFSMVLGDVARYDDRAKIARFLDRA